ncbi:MAG: hypothetical protein CMJ33_08580 [Phycisphaerae bacterium]|nr:hypothetical protein [Phycisphaerae bacterium]HAW96365.1 hypothetical protein [Phycisphaerales bacterium]
MLASHSLADVSINEIRTEESGADNNEFVELIGTPGESLDGLYLIAVGDDSGVFPPLQNGFVESYVDLTGNSINQDGFFVIAESTFTLGTPDLVAALNFEGNDNVTHFLISGFTGDVGTDIDLDDDGTIDNLSGTIIDSVALIVDAEPDGSNSDYFYSDNIVGPDGTFPPSLAYRCSDTGAWAIGEFTVGIDDTPNADNPTCGGGTGDTNVVINEIRIDQSGSDTDEYFELAGEPGTDLTGLTYLVIGGTGSDPGGKVEAVIPLDGYIIGPSGLFWVAEASITLGTPDVIVPGSEVDFQNGENVTHMLVRDCTAADNDDLDTNNDGTLDVVAFSEIIDSVSLIENFSSGFLTYSDTTVGPDGSFVPAHSYRCSTEGTWSIGEFSVGNTDTPGAENLACPAEGGCGGTTPVNCFVENAMGGCSDASCCALVVAADSGCENNWDASCVALAESLCNSTNPVPTGLALSEIRTKQGGEDTDEYVELTGTPGTSLDGVSILVVGGNGLDQNGEIETAINLGGYSVPKSGYFVVANSTFALGTADATLDFEFTDANSKTFLLVYNFDGTVLGDLDADDNCAIDGLAWDSELDGVSLLDPNATNCTYALATGGPDGIFSPGHIYVCDASTTPVSWGVGTFNPTDEDSADTPGAPNSTSCGDEPSVCGDGVCADDEDATSCPEDCDDGGTGCPEFDSRGIVYPCTYIFDTLDPTCCNTWSENCQDIYDSYCNFGATAPADIKISEIRRDQFGADADEYIEFSGAAGTSLDGHALLVIGDGASADGSGVIETYIPLSGTLNSEGLALLARPDDFTQGTPDIVWPTSWSIENSDNITVLLVYGYNAPESGIDLDVGDDGVLDEALWIDIVDCVALVETDPAVEGELIYCDTTVGPDGTFAPAHVYFDCDLNDWAIGLIDPVGDTDTPGALNPGCSSDEPDCPGDYDGDGTVGGADLSQLLGAWNSANAELDLSGDGFIDGADLTIILASWGGCS